MSGHVLGRPSCLFTHKDLVHWAHPSPHPKRHVDRFSCFCRAHDRDRPTDRLTDHATQSVAIGRVCMHVKNTQEFVNKAHNTDVVGRQCCPVCPMMRLSFANCSGPHRAVVPVCVCACVCLCVRTITSELNDL